MFRGEYRHCNGGESPTISNVAEGSIDTDYSGENPTNGNVSEGNIDIVTVVRAPQSVISKGSIDTDTVVRAQ